MEFLGKLFQHNNRRDYFYDFIVAVELPTFSPDLNPR
jgi:hypothetical protein